MGPAAHSSPTLQEISVELWRYLRTADNYSPHSIRMSNVPEPIIAPTLDDLVFAESGLLVLYEGQKVKLNLSSVPDISLFVVFFNDDSLTEQRVSVMADSESQKSGTITFQNVNSSLGTANKRPLHFATDDDGVKFYIIFGVLSIENTKVLNYSIYKSK